MATKQIHIHIHRSKDSFSESDHPRAKNGQFGSGSGGGSGGGVSKTMTHAEYHRKEAELRGGLLGALHRKVAEAHESGDANKIKLAEKVAKDYGGKMYEPKGAPAKPDDDPFHDDHYDIKDTDEDHARQEAAARARHEARTPEQRAKFEEMVARIRATHKN